MQLRLLKFKTKFAEKDFGPVNFTHFTILWYMHTNQQTIKKNYLNQIKELSLESRVDNSRSFYLFIYFLFSTIFQAVPLLYRVLVGLQINKGFVFRTLDILNT